MLTDRKSEKKETVYNKMVYNETECSEPVAKSFIRDEAAFSGFSVKSSIQVSLTLPLILLPTFYITFGIFVLLPRIYVGFLHASRAMRCPVHISKFIRLGKG